MSFIRDHALLVAAIWIAVSVVCGLWAAATIALGEREPPYDWELDSAERAPSERAPLRSWDGRGSLDAARLKRLAERSTDPDGLDFQGSWERDSGHGASW